MKTEMGFLFDGYDSAKEFFANLDITKIESNELQKYFDAARILSKKEDAADDVNLWKEILDKFIAAGCNPDADNVMSDHGNTFEEILKSRVAALFDGGLLGMLEDSSQCLCSQCRVLRKMEFVEEIDDEKLARLITFGEKDKDGEHTVFQLKCEQQRRKLGLPKESEIEAAIVILTVMNLFPDADELAKDALESIEEGIQDTVENPEDTSFGALALGTRFFEGVHQKAYPSFKVEKSFPEFSEFFEKGVMEIKEACSKLTPMRLEEMKKKSECALPYVQFFVDLIDEELKVRK